MTGAEFLVVAETAIKVIEGIISDVATGKSTPIDGAKQIQKMMDALAANDARADAP